MASFPIGSATKSLGALVKSPEVIAIATSVFITPLVQPFVDRLIARIPFLNQHRTIALIIVGVIIFMMAAKLKAGGFVRAIVIGIAGSLFIIGVAPFINQFVRR